MVSRQHKSSLLSFFFQSFEPAFKEREEKISEMQSRGPESWQESWRCGVCGPESFAWGEVLKCRGCFLGAGGYF